MGNCILQDLINRLGNLIHKFYTDVVINRKCTHLSKSFRALMNMKFKAGW